jgi:hypothetical protein
VASCRRVGVWREAPSEALVDKWLPFKEAHSILNTPRIVTQCPGNEHTNG